MRSIKKIQIEIKEIKNKLSDIKDTYPYMDAPKSVIREYDDLYCMLRDRTEELEKLLKELKS